MFAVGVVPPARPACCTPHFSPLLFLPERCLEDHELVVQVESTMAGDSKFLFRKNYGKYEFFKNPMVSPISSGSGCGALEALAVDTWVYQEQTVE